MKEVQICLGTEKVQGSNLEAVRQHGDSDQSGCQRETSYFDQNWKAASASYPDNEKQEHVTDMTHVIRFTIVLTDELQGIITVTRTSRVSLLNV